MTAVIPSEATPGTDDRAAGSGRRRPRAPRRSGLSFRTRGEIALFTGPALIVYIGFVFVPIALAAYYGFFTWNGVGAPTKFVGADNYIRAFTDPNFLKAIQHNAFYVIASLVVQGPLALLVALLINRRIRLRGMFRLLLFAPYVLSEAVAGVAWRLLLPPGGAINAILGGLGLDSWKHDWLGDPSVTNWTVLVLISWKYLGFAVVLFLAGMQSIPDELSEAASIDGAGYWQTQLRITIPLLGPTIRIWAFLSIIGSMQLFDLPYILNGGRPATGNQTMATYMMLYGQERHMYGFGSAVAVILFVLSLAVALVYQRLVLRRDTEGALTRGVF
ncbi:MAG: sugar ABC transporter permease [Bifidobacteriaceae bacterium]|jgi:ABC-type sugar transport system permease subunit|nr:sugar ABC transporter permease [Bifidobacteriaceae bacterium]